MHFSPAGKLTQQMMASLQNAALRRIRYDMRQPKYFHGRRTLQRIADSVGNRGKHVGMLTRPRAALEVADGETPGFGIG